MKPQRRWMKWVLEETAKPQPAMPWHRGARRQPEALRPVTVSVKAARAFAAQ